jgi:hypothetical protein
MSVSVSDKLAKGFRRKFYLLEMLKDVDVEFIGFGQAGLVVGIVGFFFFVRRRWDIGSFSQHVQKLQIERQQLSILSSCAFFPLPVLPALDTAAALRNSSGGISSMGLVVVVTIQVVALL